MPSQKWRLVSGTEQRTDSLQLSLPSKRLPESPGLLSYTPLQPHLQLLALFFFKQIIVKISLFFLFLKTEKPPDQTIYLFW